MMSLQAISSSMPTSFFLTESLHEEMTIFSLILPVSGHLQQQKNN